MYTSATLHLPSNLDADGKITEYIIYALKDLRNAVAHNNIIFDTRFINLTIWYIIAMNCGGRLRTTP